MFAAILLPEFHLQAALRYRGELWRKPVAVLDSLAEEPAVLEFTAAAETAGVQRGMNPTQALARCIHLQLLSRAVEQERSVTETLHGIASGSSAYVEQTTANLCTLDLQGCRASSFEKWAKPIVERLSQLQLRSQIGVAENPDLALLAAMSADAESPVCVVRESSAFLANLPLSAIAPPLPIERILYGWGIRTLGGLVRLKKDDVAARLGPEGVKLWDRAAGRSTRLLRLVRPLERFEEAFDFEQEIDTAQPILFLLRRFVDQLSSRLDAVGLVAEKLHLVLPLSNGTKYERVFMIPSPTANADVLFRILDTHFESLRLDVPPTGVRLIAEPVKPEHQQYRLFENAVRDPNRFAETLARIMAVVGSGNAGVPQMKPTYKPDQFSLNMPDFSPAKAEAQAKLNTPATKRQLIGLPLRRFRPPLPAQVHSEKGQPIYIVSDKAHGSVVDVLGPYRISGNWWEDGWSSEEWDVQMADGGLYRIAKKGDSWQVEGCYDG
jgi:protein ImuB